MRDVKEDIKNRYICINIYIMEMEKTSNYELGGW